MPRTILIKSRLRIIKNMRKHRGSSLSGRFFKNPSHLQIYFFVTSIFAQPLYVDAEIKKEFIKTSIIVCLTPHGSSKLVHYMMRIVSRDDFFWSPIILIKNFHALLVLQFCAVLWFKIKVKILALWGQSKDDCLTSRNLSECGLTVHCTIVAISALPRVSYMWVISCTVLHTLFFYTEVRSYIL